MEPRIREDDENRFIKDAHEIKPLYTEKLNRRIEEVK
jgi:hypothetical protein